MPRPQKSRKVCLPPKMLGFKPFGIAVRDTVTIVLQYDEYETIKLVIYDNLSQDEAAERMEVSRPTLTRIYNSALSKIAIAFIEGKSIIIEGGNFEFDKDWYRCKKCHKLIEGIENHTKCENCPLFGVDELISLNK
ncbi:MAG: DUF134 domain-containing protein [Bacteroidetes bacterium]|nr:DUF134 domain-containing protein [Bacteroidota bacterium]